MAQRTSIRIVGQSGSGLLSVGLILTRALRDLGFSVISDREFPSLIKGGFSSFLLNISSERIHGFSEITDILLPIDKISFVEYKDTLRDGGVLVHGYERSWGIKKIIEEFESRDVKVNYLPARTTAEEVGGWTLMQNVVLVGMLWKTLGLPFEIVESEVYNKFKSKEKFIDGNMKCLKAGYEKVDTLYPLENLPKPKKVKDHVLEGNHAMALGAVHGGLRAYYAYPMSPASTILTHMAVLAPKVGMMVKQVEDEIGVANMVIGSAYAGTRTMTATSGGGFDLMTETISLSGITETPWVCILAQRPGPATGLPTWTGQGDLKLAIYAGHGEFGRMVVAVSDCEDAFYLTQIALNMAEKYQIPLVLLTDKYLTESFQTVPAYDLNSIPIERGLVEDPEELKNLKNTDRYKITESGISKRWVPGSADAYYFANGDEHLEDGTIDESENAGEMYAKRNRKLDTIKAELPAPEIFGEKENADISFVGWGTTKGVMLDVIKAAKAQNIKVNYLHYTYLWPLRFEDFDNFYEKNNNVHLIEGNHNGQLGNLLAMKAKNKLEKRLLKWNGRLFMIEEVLRYIEENK